jgi:bisphosphoglycerate-independent phosphoglycerate mutase (AlkP superfamily)
MEAKGGRFATVIGRYCVMDRDNRWDRTELAWWTMVDSEGRRAANARAAIEAAYVADEDDKFVRPTVLDGAEPIRNGDMVGHTAVRDAVIEAVEVLDREVGRVLDTAAECGYSVILSADHGNCDEMVDPVTGDAHTQHTTSPVPCLVVDEVPWRLSTGGGIKDLAPTVLSLMGLPIPPEMRGRSLLPGTCDGVRPRLRSPKAQGWAPLVLRFDRGFDRARRYG